jgi:transcriptional regulator with PAS, ATPase and Fis domain
MGSLDTPTLVGASALVVALRHAMARVASTDSKVLITGETGTGKEVVARHLHAASGRRDRPFITINCGGLAETLLESELFGHVRGSFTGAHRDKIGKLELANSGTVFLDEIGETSPRMQGLLLRLLETGEIQKIGADDQVRRVDVRTIAATNRNLRDMVSRRLFREDLFYRLNVINLALPALRDRREDVPALVEHFLRRLQTPGGPRRSVAPEAMALLADYRWPGNVRELQNVVERMSVRSRSAVMTVADVPPEMRPAGAATAPGHGGASTADDLYRGLVEDQQSFWTTVYPLFMRRDIPRDVVRDVVRRGLQEALGNYKVVVRMFNMPPDEYKKFMNFLRKHGCQPSFKEFRP